MIIPIGAVPDSRVVWKNPAQPDDPLALGNTRILPAKHTPNSSCLASMITPRAGSIPPHPEIGSCDTRASPSATVPGTTDLPRNETMSGSQLISCSPPFQRPVTAAATHSSSVPNQASMPRIAGR